MATIAVGALLAVGAIVFAIFELPGHPSWWLVGAIAVAAVVAAGLIGWGTDRQRAAEPMVEAAPRRPLGMGTLVPTLAGGLVIVLGLLALGVWLGLLWRSPGTGALVQAGLAVALAIALGRIRRPCLAAAALVAVPMACAAGGPGAGTLRAVASPVVVLASPHAAPGHPTAEVFRIAKANVRGDLVGGTVRDALPHLKAGRSLLGFMIAAPLVGPHWTPGHPVPMWAICSAAWSRRDGARAVWLARLRRRCLSGWQQGAGVWIRIRRTESNLASEATEASRKDHQLESIAGAPWVRWSASTDRDAAPHVMSLVATALAGALGWLVLAGWWLLGERRRRGAMARRSGTDVPTSGV